MPNGKEPTLYPPEPEAFNIPFTSTTPYGPGRGAPVPSPVGVSGKIPSLWRGWEKGVRKYWEEPIWELERQAQEKLEQWGAFKPAPSPFPEWWQERPEEAPFKTAHYWLWGRPPEEIPPSEPTLYPPEPEAFNIPFSAADYAARPLADKYINYPSLLESLERSVEQAREEWGASGADEEAIEKALASLRIAWLEENSYGKVVVDEAGREITRADAFGMIEQDPENAGREVIANYILGNDDVTQVEFSLAEAFGISDEQLGALRQEWQAKVGSAATIREAAGDFKTRSDEILATEGNYLTKANALQQLYTEYWQKGLATEEVMGGGSIDFLLDMAYETLTDEQKREADIIRSSTWAGWEEPKARVAEGAKPTKEKPVDVGELNSLLAPFGASVIGNYPYISPITEAHLRAMPTNVLEKMARYLEGKGISWRDFLELGRGQGAAPRAQWAPARQWWS